MKGITRGVILDLAERQGLAVEERRFGIEEALAAAEAFVTAATTLVMPVVRIDGRPVASGRPGKLATSLRKLFHSQAEIASTWSTQPAAAPAATPK